MLLQGIGQLEMKLLKSALKDLNCGAEEANRSIGGTEIFWVAGFRNGDN